MQIEYNYNNAVTHIQKAASDGAKLAVLPEYFLTSWVPKDPQFADLCGQWEIYLQKFQAVAKDCDISIVPGTIVQRMPGANEGEYELHNVCYFIDNRGEILGRYVKKNLW